LGAQVFPGDSESRRLIGANDQESERFNISTSSNQWKYRSGD
jgi:hypothetical protein